jgi:hypothetical protein
MGANGGRLALPARWTKLRDGKWAVRLDGTKVRIGDTIAVTRRGGSIAKVTVRSILWEGPGAQLLLVSPATRAERPRTPVAV